MNTLTAVLCLLINNSLVKDTYYSIALYLLQNLYTVQDLSLNELALRTHSSVTTIKKFIKTLGVENYTMFRDNIRIGADVRLHQMEKRYRDSDETDILKKISLYYPEMDLAELSRTADRFIEEICKVQRIVVIGAVYPNALAVNFQEDMIVMGKFTYIHPITYDYSHDFVNINDDDFVILTTITGTYFNVFQSRRTQFRKIKHAAVITSEDDFSSAFPDAIVLKLPSHGDNEYYNSFLLHFYELLKHRYYRIWIKNEFARRL